MSFDVLIIGLGQIGMGYDLHHNDATSQTYTHARAFSQHPDFSLIAAVDTDKNLREIFKQKYNGLTYGKVDEALKSNNPDLVVIAVPTQYHYEILRQVLETSSPRVVLCEKPLSYSLDEANSMVELCAKNNVNLFVNYMRRSDPAVIEIKRRLDSGEIATPIKGTCWYSKGFQHNGSHFFNLLEFWLGKFISFEILEVGRLWDNKDPEPDLHLVFNQGTVVMLAAWEEKFSHYGIELLAKNGRLRYEQGGKSVYWQELLGDKNFDGYTTLNNEITTLDSGMERYQWQVAEQLAFSLSDKSYQLCSGTEALETLKNIHNIIDKR